jgi:hypothetical protein
MWYGYTCGFVRYFGMLHMGPQLIMAGANQQYRGCENQLSKT